MNRDDGGGGEAGTSSPPPSLLPPSPAPHAHLCPRTASPPPFPSIPNPTPTSPYTPPTSSRPPTPSHQPVGAGALPPSPPHPTRSIPDPHPTPLPRGAGAICVSCAIATQRQPRAHRRLRYRWGARRVWCAVPEGMNVIRALSSGPCGCFGSAGARLILGRSTVGAIFGPPVKLACGGRGVSANASGLMSHGHVARGEGMDAGGSERGRGG